MPDPSPQSRSVIAPGGKVDPEALRRAIADSPDDITQAADETNDDAPNRVVFRLSRDLNKRLDKYLTDRIPFMSRTQLQRLIDEGGVTVNTRAPRPATKLRLNDVVEVFVPPPPATDIQPEPIPLDVLYEDDHLVVLNKQTDIIVHPARSHNTGTMLNALVHHFQQTGGALSEVGKDLARPGVVHRLDRNTTGCIVFAKDDQTHWNLGRQFEHRTVDKRYIAVTHGSFHPSTDVIDLSIGPHPSREKGLREKYVVRHDELGKPSVTIARLLGSFVIDNQTLSLVELELKTGRTHQIRVHLSHLGFPIVGDDMYAGKPVTLPNGRTIDRQALHAATLTFDHPTLDRRTTFTAPLPVDLREMVAPLAGTAQLRKPPGATVDLDTLLGGDCP